MDFCYLSKFDFSYLFNTYVFLKRARVAHTYKTKLPLTLLLFKIYVFLKRARVAHTYKTKLPLTRLLFKICSSNARASRIPIKPSSRKHFTFQDLCVLKTRVRRAYL